MYVDLEETGSQEMVDLSGDTYGCGGYGFYVSPHNGSGSGGRTSIGKGVDKERAKTDRKPDFVSAALRPVFRGIFAGSKRDDPFEGFIGRNGRETDE